MAKGYNHDLETLEREGGGEGEEGERGLMCLHACCEGAFGAII